MPIHSHPIARTTLLFLALGSFLAGCSSKPEPPPPTESAKPADSAKATKVVAPDDAGPEKRR